MLEIRRTSAARPAPHIKGISPFSEKQWEWLKSALRGNRVLFLSARLLFALFFLLTSSYCLLAYIPFTYQWVIKCTLVRWLPVFVAWHPALYWAAIALAASTLLPDLRAPQTRWLSAGFVVFHAIGGVILLFHPLSNLSNDSRSYCWSLISLFPLLWVAAIDLAGQGRNRNWPPKNDQHLTFSTVAFTAIFLSALSFAVLNLRFARSSETWLRPPELAVAASWSLATHLLVFIFLFVVFRSIRSVARRLPGETKIEFWMCNGLIFLLLELLIRKTILPALSFDNGLADLFALAVSVSLVALMSGQSLRIQAAGETEATNGFELAFAPLLLLFGPARHSRGPLRFVCAGMIVLGAWAIPASVATRDWDFLFQKLGVVATWIGGFGFFYAVQRRGKPDRHSLATVLLIAAVSAGCHVLLGASAALWPALLRDERLDVSAALERYANYDVSFRMARDILRPSFNLFRSTTANPTEDQAPVSRDESFYGFLQQNTNLLPSVKVTAPDINFAGPLTRTKEPKPHIFIFVIDSLRQDYLSPYNKSVNFTPNIESFARESLVMRNAFTRYGGTVLAEPSIWTGALGLHKQYIEPYYPMNSLQKLIEVEGYESFLTIDPVVRIISKPSLDAVELDKGYLWFEYDFCRTLKELQTRMDQRQDPARPMFVYTEPQNVHRVVLRDKGDPVPAGERYPGFFAPYASQVKYMDACFGEFIEHLKSRGLYENSVVILTSDHGDSLGEEGRWGHSYWMFPEIIRVPLIMHVPAPLLKGMTWNPKLVSFTTDITPTLHYLLGHRPIERSEMFGRPLVTATEKEQTDYLQKSYLLVSSYGPVYAALDGDGRSLFIADAVNRKDYFFNLGDDPKGTRNRLTPAIQAEKQKLIHDLVVSVNRFYGLGEYP